MSNVIDIKNKNWPIPIHSSQMSEPWVQAALKEGQAFQLKYEVSFVHKEPAVGEVNPEHEKKRKEVEQEGKAKL